MTLKQYQKYICWVFIKNFIYISSVFFFIVILINFFEEIRFFEKYDIEIYYTIYLSFLNAPSLIFEIFPFIFLISVKFFYLQLEENKEMEILNSNGLSRLKIISLLSLLSLAIGLILLLFFYSFSSKLKTNYLDIKNRFSNNNDYLAVVNDRGLWIKEEVDDYLYIIHAEKFDKNLLRLITISEIDKYYNNKNTIFAQTANIISKNWKLNDVSILSKDGKKNKYKTIVHNSTFNGEIISNLFSNLNSLNIFELHELSNNYSKIGYSNTEIKIHLNKIYSMPIFYIIMTVLGFIIINKLNNLNSKFFTILFGVFISVLVYYLNYFSGLLGNKGALPIYLSVWTPLIILFLICNIGLIRINENK